MILATKAAATVLAAALGTGAAVTVALPEKAPSPGYVHYEGATVDVTPKDGTRGLLLRAEDGTVIGAMGTADEASIQGCHPTDPALVWVHQITTGTHSGGWGAMAGYVRHQFADVDGVVPCGG
ncbi:hypothetical protein OHA84_38690 [Streptomyces sp. NBC_00513]|uniref:hypothetical protein n=1 Tax=unclassified Streptomyces TaxID=2593676 RepID=UPI0022543D4F|nr:hypothetical protein [Streptomyces sp. NBC_00424]MCX5079377.1 hypothetical protein [Streptomyces sp. NBC_00424]MCX5079387.1 hypothetical protein [Streptomyces sp. NBC_00424]WUD46459.1 hypothetical protein OHA84_38740 [Streptomyces sp. NBC_00513]WUD46469.1 hypothetical protein OHA84_38690 [Streptomyces sp. NBC_00513]